MNVSVQVSKNTLQLVRIASLLISFLAFGVVLYVGMVIGFDLPKWRMNGETNTMIVYFISFAVSTAIGMVGMHVNDTTSKLLNPVVETDEEEED